MKTTSPLLVASATLLVTFLACGCASGLGKATVRAGFSTVTPPSNASGPTTVAVAESATKVVVDAGTKVTSSPASAASAAKEVVEFPKMVIDQTTTSNSTSVAPPRAPDQSVALAKVDVADRRPLLYVAIGLLLVAIGVGSPGLLDHPTAGLAIAAGAGIFFLAWRAASEPWLAYAGGALALVGVALAVGYEISQMHARQAAKLSSSLSAPTTTAITKPPAVQP